MAGRRRNQSAAIRFGPALKAAFLCLLIAGSAMGYVWQKSQIYQLGRQIGVREARLKQLRHENRRLRDQLGILSSPVMLDQRVRQLRLGLAPAQPTQFRCLPEPVAAPENEKAVRQLAERQAGPPLTP